MACPYSRSRLGHGWRALGHDDFHCSCRYIHTYIHTCVCVCVHAQWGILYNSKRNSKILLAPVFHFSNREDDQRQELEALRVRLAAAEGREAELRRLRGEGVQQKDEGLRLKGSGRLRHYHEEMECCCV